MKKFYKRILNKKGVTLVELIVVLLVSSILLGIAIGMLKPVTNLLNSIKSNAHMDTLSDTVNEYIRGSLDKAVDAKILVYPDVLSEEDSDYYKNAKLAIMQAWVDFTGKYKTENGYQVRALGVMQNYNDDFRLYDFGDVTKINYEWGESTPKIVLNSNSAEDVDDGIHGYTFWKLLKFRDGGGSGLTDSGYGVDGEKFGLFHAFTEYFYTNGKENSAVNYSLQVAFETAGKTLEDGSTDIDYLTVCSQMFERHGEKKTDGSEYTQTHEPANQMKSLSFKLLNGKVSLDDLSEGNINKVETVDGGKQIVAGDNGFKDNLVILYAVKKDVFATPAPPSFVTEGGNIYGGYHPTTGHWGTTWVGINDGKIGQPNLLIKNVSGGTVDTKDVVVEFRGDFSSKITDLYIAQNGSPKITRASGAAESISTIHGERTAEDTYKVTFGDSDGTGLIWNDGETLTIGKLEIKDTGNQRLVDDESIRMTATIYINGEAIWTASFKK